MKLFLIVPGMLDCGEQLFPIRPQIYDGVFFRTIDNYG